jgi:ElaB/YqjD/DUF883 family membrane-anchored ribosome-binding protein
MGTNISSQLIDSTSSLVGEVMNEMTTKVENKTSTYTGAFQIMKVEFSNMNIEGCSILLEQHAEVSVSALLNNTTKLTTDLSTSLMSKIKEEMKNTIEQVNKKLNLGQVNTARAIAKTNTYLEQNLTNNISVGISNSLKQTTEGTQVIDFNMKNSDIKCPSGGMIKVSQNMLIDVISKNIATSIVDNTIENVVTGTLEKEIKNKGTQLNEGIDIAFILMVCVIIASCIGLSYLGIKFGSGGKKMKNIPPMAIPVNPPMTIPVNPPMAQPTYLPMAIPVNPTQQPTYLPMTPQTVDIPTQQPSDPTPQSVNQTPQSVNQIQQQSVNQIQTGGDDVDDDGDGLYIGMLIAGGIGLSGMAAIGVLYKQWFLPKKKEISDTYDIS